ncbi:hypothetical protein, secreted [gut metagenome]|uniref:Uncharacterized protein n=1 Tax=gut metagenome TaxID=749906 RepID=J9FVD6_9ZZZZ
MKKNIFIILTVLLSFPLSSIAQDDDVYFVPSKSKKEKNKKANRQEKLKSDYSLFEDNRYEQDNLEYDNWAEHRYNGAMDVDEYNRRKPKKTEQSAEAKKFEDEDYEENYSGTYTARIVRFHSPTIGVFVSSPFYSDYIDIWYDPWYYDPWYGYTYLGWSSWYRPAWYWHSSCFWYDPWHCHWHPHFGCHYPYYPSYRPIPNGANRGPHGGYVYYRGRNNIVTGQHNNYRPSRDFGWNSGRRPSRDFINGNSRPSRDYGNGRRPSRDFGNSRRPSREFGNSERRPSRDFDHSTPSRNFNQGNRPSRDFAPSRPSRSFNDVPRTHFNQGGRSGGGRNFGGRR